MKKSEYMECEYCKVFEVCFWSKALNRNFCSVVHEAAFEIELEEQKSKGANAKRRV